MSEFIESRLPVDVAPGVQSAARFMTTVKRLRGGGEHRNALWAHPLRTFQAEYNARDRNRIEDELYSFIMETQGSLKAFRVRDWSDYTATNEPIGTGDGSSFWFRLTKRYGSYSRPITKPDPSNVNIQVDGVTIDPANYLVDVTNGVLILINTPSVGQSISWSGQFDVPARFEGDALEVVMFTAQTGGVSQVDLSEIRPRDTTDPVRYQELRDLTSKYGKDAILSMYDVLDFHVNTQWRITQ